MKKVLVVASLAMFFMSCKKDKFCYECNAENITTSVVQYSESACGLTSDDQESKVASFKSRYNENYNVSCSQTTED